VVLECDDRRSTLSRQPARARRRATTPDRAVWGPRGGCRRVNASPRRRTARLRGSPRPRRSDHVVPPSRHGASLVCSRGRPTSQAGCCVSAPCGWGSASHLDRLRLLVVSAELLETCLATFWNVGWTDSCGDGVHGSPLLKPRTHRRLSDRERAHRRNQLHLYGVGHQRRGLERPASPRSADRGGQSGARRVEKAIAMGPVGLAGSRAGGTARWPYRKPARRMRTAFGTRLPTPRSSGTAAEDRDRRPQTRLRAQALPR
jgi:hypothetical protein